MSPPLPLAPPTARPAPRPGIELALRLDRPGFTLDVQTLLPGRGVTALFGPSGSGKTTLLRCIAGLERAPGGRVVFQGEVWQDGRQWLPTHRRALGYVFQEASLFAHLDVAGNLRYGLKRLGADDQALEQAVALLGIGHLLERRPQGLSGGERQRVGIARALALRPRVLLMDEPLAALDPARRREVLPYLERLREELDIPVLYVSHAVDEVARLADHLLLLDGGRVQAQGPLDELLTRLDGPLRLGEDAGVVLAGTLAERDTAWHLVRVDFPGGRLWTRDPGLPLGRPVRVRVLARDVSLARQPPWSSSIQNVLTGVVDAVAGEAHPAVALLRIEVTDSSGAHARLLARVTRRAAALLDLQPGTPVWVQVKSAALLEG
ncbi:MAG: molybdenum ABC transporter ATP-binding protein [Burkholderiaceae bacterium]|nr:molybdenum ABC transporter ATP-binding protein [Burkholderiaceae bacterium]